jgi:hypothetical protein
LIGLESLLIGENGSFFASKAPRRQFTLSQGFKTLFLTCFYLLFRLLDQWIRAQAAPELIAVGN